MTITEKDLQEWGALCDEADPPPWDCAHGYEYSRRHPPQVGLPTANTRFANTARTVMPRLIAEFVQMRGEYSVLSGMAEAAREDGQEQYARAERAEAEVKRLREDLENYRGDEVERLMNVAQQFRTRAERAEAALGEAAGAAADEMVDYGKSAQQAVFHAVKAVARKALQQQTIDEENER